MTTGERIKTARKKAGMTQSELAQKLSIPFQSISQWERDLRNPKLETLKRIATVLGVPWHELYSDSEQIQENAKKADAIAQLAYNQFKGEYQIREAGSNKSREMTYSDYFNLFKESSEQKIKYLSLFEMLNRRGQQKAVERVEELTEIPRYRAETAPQPPVPTSEGTDTTPPEKSVEGPQAGE